ncbi:hypothetical protein BGZ50_000688 [Haplosporangium sp. Z 11]|nr:hypothetical protein BGZ50_000688 [Haplosporangium sp. Z 11]
MPASVWGMASVFIEGQSMIVHGGTYTSKSEPLGQTFALNLATNWTTAQPDFKRLANGFSDYNFASTLQNDGQTWFLLANATARRYFIHNDTWRDMGYSNVVNPIRGLGAATDPTSGLLYIVNGYVTNETIVSMQQYNPIAGGIYSLDMDPVLVGMVSFAVVWSIVRSSLLVYGGMTITGRATQRGLYEYLPTIGWKLLSDKGDVPPARKNHCLVPAYNGTKMIVFGGFDQNDNVMSDIYSLDVASMTWTKLTEGARSIARANHVCAVTNDMFVAWSGCDSNFNSLRDNVTVVYNMKKNVWQEMYSPLPESGDPVEPTPPPKDLPLGAIIGAVAGVLCVFAFAGFFVFYRRRKHQQYSKTSNGSNSTDSDDRHHDNNNNNDNGSENDGYPLINSADISTTGMYSSATKVPETGDVGADLKKDETVYRPNEIIAIKQVQGRSPHAITDTNEGLIETGIDWY